MPDNNNHRVAYQMVSCRGVGKPISSILSIKARGEYPRMVLHDTLIECVERLNATGYPTTSYKLIAECTDRGVEKYTPRPFSDFPGLWEHELWHKMIREGEGLKRSLELAYGFLEESSCYAIGDSIKDDKEPIDRRIISSLDLVPFYHKAEYLSSNGGLMTDDISEMEKMINGCDFKFSHLNWAALMDCMDNLLVYGLCCHLIAEVGIDKAKELFIEAIEMVEETKDPKAGPQLLVTKVESGAEFLPHNYPLPREKMVGTPESNCLYGDFGDFSIKLWSYDQVVQRIVGATYMQFEDELTVWSDKIGVEPIDRCS